MDLVTYLTSRSSNLATMKATHLELSTLTGSTLNVTTNITTPSVTASTLIVSTINGLLPGTGSVSALSSTIVSIGASTNQTYNNFSNGSYLTWVTAKEAMSSANKTVQSANGLYQMIVANATSGLFLSSDSGITWSTLTGGLPTLTGNAYWSDGAISANGQYITLSIYGGSLWMSADYGRTFALTNQPTPNIWLPLNGNVTDSMGLSVVTTPGTVPGYVTLNYPGYTAQAVNLLNTAGSTATRYIRGTWTGSPSGNFTVSFWFNAQALGAQQQALFVAYGGNYVIALNASNQITWYIPSGGSGLIAVTGPVVNINTWYYITAIFQTNGTCSLYVNNSLAGTYTNVGGVGSYTTTLFAIGTYDSSLLSAFNGYVDDLKITNSVSTYVPIPLLQPNIWMPFENSAGDLGSYSMPPSAVPFIYLPFEGNVTDSIGSSAPTTPGTVPGYVAVNREGYTGQAVNLANTAGSNATRYVRGTWAGSANFTVSFWVNPQSLTGVQQQVFAAYSGSLVVYITSSNQLAWYIPTGGGTNAATMGTTSFALVTNTWYYVTIIFQTSGVCSFYVNNALIATYTNVSGVGTLTTTQFSLGCNDNAIGVSFNGYIDDLRIYNSAIPYVPVSVTTVTGSLSYVPGVVGVNAVNIANTAGSTATNFIKGAWTGSPNFTVSFWFNSQSLSATVNQCIWYAYNSYVGILIDSTNRVIFYGPNGSTANVIVATSSPISLNTWYHVHAIFQSNGVCSLHINGSLIGTYTNSGGVGTLTTTQFGVGVVDNSTSYAFNGYIDDLRLYNTVVPIQALFPQNYRALSLSGTGQYALAAAASGWVVGSSDSLRTWAKQTVNVGTQSDLIQPNMTGLGANTWSTNGVNWTASSSSNYGSPYISYNAFNNTSILADGWAASATNYNTSGTYTTGSPITTTVIGIIGPVSGDWLQIQSNVPLVMYSYLINVLNINGVPKTIVIAGSNDGTTWYALQSASYGTNPYTAQFQKTSGILLVNYSGSQTIIGNGSSVTVTTEPYSYSTTAYQYFRLIYTSNFSHTGSSYAQTTEWLINFARPPTHALSMNHTGQYQLVATGPAAGSIMPNQTGLAAGSSPTVSTSWTQSGVNWVASASSNNGSTQSAHKVFNNAPGDAWLSDNVTQRYTAAGVTNSNTSTTSVIGIGTVTGEWIQIQSSVPLVLSSFGLGIGLNAWQYTNSPSTYYIIGSNDGITWYPLQYGAFTITNFVGSTNQITINTTGTQTLSGMTGSVATTSYGTSTQAYTYFRMIGTSIMRYGGQTSSYMEIGEWYLNFRNSVSYSTNYGATWQNTSPTVSNESVALSPSGQYTLSTNSVAPLARLTLDNTNVDSQGVLTPTTGGTSPTYPDAPKVVGSNSALFANTAGSTASVYLNYTVPAVFNKPPALTMSCWVYPSGLSSSGSVPVAFNNGGSTPGPYISCWSNRTECSIYNTSGGAIYAAYYSPVSINTWTHLAMTFNVGILTLYVNGISRATTTTSNITLNLSTNNNITNLFLGSLWTSSGYAFEGNIDDVRLYTSALSADEINGLFRNPALTQTVAVSNSYLPITTYTEPTLPGITANVVDTAVSQTGQYMVAVTSSTTNNVYYSTDYGTTFTALTVGSSAMVSCSISYDGSYLTVTNATTTYTLNRNARGFSVAIGNQAGLINQAQNAIAIGDKAGRTNQSANSIILNASGTALDAIMPGMYAAPVANYTTSSALSFNLLGYGSDSQIVQSSALTVLQNGNVTVGNALVSQHGYVSPQGLYMNTTAVQQTYYFQIGLLEGWSEHWLSCESNAMVGATKIQWNASTWNGSSNGGVPVTVTNNSSSSYVNPVRAVYVVNVTGISQQNTSQVWIQVVLNSTTFIRHSYQSGGIFDHGANYGVLITSLSAPLLSFPPPGYTTQQTYTLSSSAGVSTYALMGQNVGVGTATPGYPLHVVGNINLTGSILYNGVAITTGTASYWNTGTGGVIYYNGGSVAVGTASPLSRFTIRCPYGDGQAGGLCIDSTDGSVYNMRLSSFVQGGGQVGYQFGVNNLSASYPNTLVLGYNGNVGIGNTLPLGPFSVGNSAIANSDGFIVQGKNNAVGGSRHNRMGYDANFNFVLVGDYGATNTVSTWNPQVYCAWSSPANSLVINGSGYVGIGSGSPAYTLDVVGNARISGSIFSSSVSVTFTGTFTNIFTCSTNRGYLLTIADNGPDGTYGVFILIPTQNVITQLTGNNITLQYSGLTVQAKSSNSVSYTKTCNVIQLS